MSDDNIVKFPEIKDTVHILKLKVPAVIRMSKEADSDIALEIERFEDNYLEKLFLVFAVNYPLLGWG